MAGTSEKEGSKTRLMGAHRSLGRTVGSNATLFSKLFISSIDLSVTAHGCEKFFAEKVSTEYHKLARGSEDVSCAGGAFDAFRNSQQDWIGRFTPHRAPGLDSRRQSCVYRKLTPGRSGDEVRQGSRKTRPLNGARDRRIFIQRSVRSDVIVIAGIGSQDSTQMRLA